MLAIRLSRVGKKKYATFRVVVSEKTKDTVGNYLELLGNYNPHTNEAELKADRIKHWISKGAQPSGSVHNLLVEQKVIDGEKIKVANIKKKKVKKEEGETAKKQEEPKAAPVEKKKEPKESTKEPKKEEKKDTPQEGKK